MKTWYKYITWASCVFFFQTFTNDRVHVTRSCASDVKRILQSAASSSLLSRDGDSRSRSTSRVYWRQGMSYLFSHREPSSDISWKRHFTTDGFPVLYFFPLILWATPCFWEGWNPENPKKPWRQGMSHLFSHREPGSDISWKRHLTTDGFPVLYYYFFHWFCGQLLAFGRDKIR